MIDRITADGEETPVLVRLSQQDEMLPGPYQATLPGIFVTPPWTVDLAPGPWQLRISRGPQFQTLEGTLQCNSGETIEAGSIELTRNVDLAELGWFGGDGDGDVYHDEKIYTDVNAETAADISQAMGLDWVGVGSWSNGPLGGPRSKTWDEARAFMRTHSHSRFLFMWTDERPKSQEGHACFVGLDRPDEDPFAAEAVRNGQTIVSTGPVLVADLDGRPPGTTVSTNQSHRIRVQAWARGDHANAPLRRLELWAHGQVIETKTLEDDSQQVEATFDWAPEGEFDWVAVRAVARGGWAVIRSERDSGRTTGGRRVFAGGIVAVKRL